MKTVKCPECGSGLKVVFKDESFEGWKKCNKCGSFSFVIADDVRAEAVSLKSLFENAKDKKRLAEAIDYLLTHGGIAFIDELLFHVGKKVEPDLTVFEKYGVIKRVKDSYEINKELVDELEAHTLSTLNKFKEI